MVGLSVMSDNNFGVCPNTCQDVRTMLKKTYCYGVIKGEPFGNIMITLQYVKLIKYAGGRPSLCIATIILLLTRSDGSKWIFYS